MIPSRRPDPAALSRSRPGRVAWMPCLPGAGRDHRRLQPRDDEERLPPGRHGQRGEPLERHGVVPGEVAQVRAGSDDDEIHPQLAGDVAGGVQPLRGHQPRPLSDLRAARHVEQRSQGARGAHRPTGGRYRPGL